MFEGINVIAVLGTTFFMMASATVWYSPFMFGRLWLKELKVTEEEIEASRNNVYTHLGLTAVAYIIALTVLSLAQYHFDGAMFTVLELAVLFAVLPTALLGNTVLLENRSKVYFLINAGFSLYFIVVGMLMLNYWPW